jgi:hypothetical protein
MQEKHHIIATLASSTPTRLLQLLWSLVMKRTLLSRAIVLMVLGLSLTFSAQAAVRLLGRADLASNLTDLSGLSDTLEDGTPHNRLGAFGSGIAYAGGSRFLVVPDRGPNASSYNPSVDNTTSFQARFQEF